jgi:hypothetical protein
MQNKKNVLILTVILLSIAVVVLLQKYNITTQGPLSIGGTSELTHGEKAIEKDTSSKIYNSKPIVKVEAPTQSDILQLDASTARSFRPLLLEDLLNPDDRTERFDRYVTNHNNLLSIVHSLRGIQNKTIDIKSITIDQLKQWTQTLIIDIHFSNATFQGLAVGIDVSNIEEFDLSKLPAEADFTKRLSVDYLNAVRSLAEQTQSLQNSGEDNLREKSNIIRKIASLTKRTKKQSDVFYTTRMKRYFKGRDYTLQQKITFANGFVQSKDVQLMAAAKQYFEYAMQLSEYENQKAEIEKIITNLSRI